MRNLTLTAASLAVTLLFAVSANAQQAETGKVIVIENEEQAVRMAAQDENIANLRTDSARQLSGGKYFEALKSATKAVRETEDLYGKEHIRYANALTNLAVAQKLNNQLVKAEATLAESIKVRQSLGDLGSSMLVADMSNLGGMYITTRDYEKAQSVLNKAMNIRKGEKDLASASVRTNLGLLAKARGQNDVAERYFREAIDIKRSAIGDDSVEIAVDYNNLANLYVNDRKPEKALDLYEKALKIKKNRYGDEHPSTAISLNNLGTAYMEAGKLDKAEQHLVKALAIRERKLQKDDVAIADTLSNLSFVYALTSRQAEADNAKRRAQTIYERSM